MSIKVRFRSILPQSGGLYSWTYPVRSAQTGQAPAKLSLDLQIRSTTPLRSVFSPLPGVQVLHKGDSEARVSLELLPGQVPSRDLTVFYGLSDREFGLHLLTYRKALEPGYFMMVLAPKRDWDDAATTMRVVQFVLDTSGSMRGKKMDQAKAALRYFVRSLRRHDRFNVVPFATEAQPFFREPVEASEDTIARALAKIEGLEAQGGTNIEDALRVALTAAVGEHGSVPLQTLPITVFLTDGEPTVGTTDVEQLLAKVRQNNQLGARVFVLGVGDEVNTRLLDRIAEDSRGDRDYVRPDEDIEVKTSALFAKLSHPVLTDLEIRCDDLDLFDVYPRRLPDLFKGGQIQVVGRYRGDGHRAVRLRGKLAGETKEFVFEGSFAACAMEHDFVPTLWANRKLGMLLDAIRLNGPRAELTEEVKRLSREFGIVTPFTSHLIVEEGMRLAGVTPGRAVQGSGDDFFMGAPSAQGPATPGAIAPTNRVTRELQRAGEADAEAKVRAAQTRVRDEVARAEEQLSQIMRPAGPATGAGAVERSVVLRAQKDGAATGGGAAGVLSRRVKDRTLYLAQGVWVEQGLPSDWERVATRVAAFSEEYFALLREHPELKDILAFSTRVAVRVGERIVTTTE
jgi:Ca-activated chloride channel family protein